LTDGYHLEPLKLEHHDEKITEAHRDGAPAPGATFTNDGGVFIVGPIYSSTDQLPPADLDIAIDQDSHVYVIERVPQITPDPYVACECVPQPCPRAGPAELHRIYYGPLPAGATVVGSKSVSYPETRLAPTYVDPSNKCTCPAS
jgi:hypothetical protein